jgi:hypothetical protein
LFSLVLLFISFDFYQLGGSVFKIFQQKQMRVPDTVCPVGGVLQDPYSAKQQSGNEN